MTDGSTICHDLDLLDDWLAGKGYGEEAGLVLRALTLINKLQDGVRTTIQERDVLSGENWDLRAENAKLRQAMHDIYEIYAGSEGIPRPVTMSEAYLCDLMMQMVAIAAKHKRAAALKETGDE